MDASAIKAIAELAISAARANKLETAMPAIVIGGEVESLEHFENGRSRFRGCLKTSSIADFVAYVKYDHGVNKPPQAVIDVTRLSIEASLACVKRDNSIDKGMQPHAFIDATHLSATAYFNLGNHLRPGHADHLAQLKLERTAAFRALIGIDGMRLDQKALAEWVEEWAWQISITNENGETLPLPSAISAIRSVKVKASTESTTTVRNYAQSRTAMEVIEARATGAANLPSRLTFRFTPAFGLPEQSADLRISLIANPEEKPTFALRWIGREQVVEAIATDFKLVLFEEIGQSASLTIGTFTP